MKYGLNDRPGIVPLVLYGFQWFAATLPNIVIMGLVVARLQFDSLAPQMLYLQKLFMLMGVTTAVQALWGHRLPLVTGPSAPLLIGFIASLDAGFDAMHTSVIIAGLLMAVAGFSGMLSRLRTFFTPRITSVILVLIALTVVPTIRGLVFLGNSAPAGNLVFALAMVLAMITVNNLLPGVLKSLTVIIGFVAGTAVHFLLFGVPALPEAGSGGGGASILIPNLVFDPGTILAFMFCYLALVINELSSIQAIGHMLDVTDLDWRIKRGAGLQGVANMASGALGVIGPVDFSLSAGVIAATGCASRYTLAPAGAALILCSFSGEAAQYLSCIPNPVMGAMMLYLMSSQLASGATMLVTGRSIADFASAVTVALPLMVGTLVAFAPSEGMAGFPDLLRPIVGNGFVMGTITVILLEHGVFRRKTAA